MTFTHQPIRSRKPPPYQRPDQDRLGGGDNPGHQVRRVRLIKRQPQTQVRLMALINHRQTDRQT